VKGFFCRAAHIEANDAFVKNRGDFAAEGYPLNVGAQQGSLSDVRVVFCVTSPGLLPRRGIGLTVARPLKK
jgi:hypothetical protein